MSPTCSYPSVYSRDWAASHHHPHYYHAAKCKILIEWSDSESLYWIRQVCYTIQCALGRVNAVSTRNRQTERAYCQTTTVSHFPQSSIAPLHHCTNARRKGHDSVGYHFDVILSVAVVWTRISFCAAVSWSRHITYHTISYTSRFV